ncbi:LytR/AlgR family response regulator transcription factor [Terriglobus sp. ADX1]|uniref:LytR/AlgR family response regulator transcription factor n=1 Tax=Terriglobus sp. ADX1 TaxID=2794063 RepID=UPI002FE68F8E
MRLLIVDDEPVIRTGIRHHLASLPWVNVVGECDSVSEAVNTLRSRTVDLVLLDVQMSDGTGFDVIRRIGPRSMPPVVFVTAFDHYAIQAFELNAVDYLLKPFDDTRLYQSLERVRERFAAPNTLVQQLESLLEARNSRWLQRVVVRNEDSIDLVPVATIDWIESANNYTVLHCGEQTHILGETLTNLEQRLDPEDFLRIHRRRIVHLPCVVRLHPIPGGVYDVELRNGQRILTGRQYRDAIQGLLRNSVIG